MVNQFSIPRGTSDILPSEISQWRDIEKHARKILKRYGYQEIVTPLFEESSLFKRSLGQTSDVVNKQLLELTSNKDNSQYALRPEGTASVVRSYVENNFESKEGISKFFYIGPMFRGERPQKGRLRQFHQIGVEVIGPGTKNPLLDAEVISLSLELLKSFGLKDVELKINSLGSAEDKKGFSSHLRSLLKSSLKLLCAECQDRFDRNVFRILDCKNKECKDVVSKLDLGDSHLSADSRKYFAEVRNALDVLKINYSLSSQLVRGLDYYTQTVFEITSSGLGSQDAVGAGGRYNGLVSEIGGEKYKDVGAVGFSLGVERILLAKPQELHEEKIDVFIVSMNKECELKAFDLLHQIRHSGQSADMGYQGGSMKSQMRQANKSGAHYVIILGDEEIKNNEASIKNMLSGNQEKISLDHIGGFFRKHRN